MNNKRKGNISSEQKREMLEFLNRNPDLRKGKFTKDFTYKKSQELWIQLSNQLNAMPGAHKEWKLWRKTWQDLKGSAKKKYSEINTHRRRTGGGPVINTSTTEEEDIIISMIGTSATEGHPDILESETIFEDITNIPEVDDMANPDRDGINDLIMFEEHDYNIRDVEITNINQSEQRYSFEEKITQSSDDPNLLLKGNKEPEKLGESKSKRKKVVRVERLNHTIAATEKLAEQTDLITKQTGEYQRNKLKLYEKDIEAKNRIASALEQIARKLSN